MTNNPRRKSFLTVLLSLGIVLLGVLWNVPMAQAQVLYGSVVGHVTDPSGAAIPGAKVTITNPDTNQSRDTTTDMAGDYSFTAVQTGTYKLRVSQERFKVFERSDV